MFVFGVGKTNRFEAPQAAGEAIFCRLLHRFMSDVTRRYLLREHAIFSISYYKVEIRATRPCVIFPPTKRVSTKGDQ